MIQPNNIEIVGCFSKTKGFSLSDPFLLWLTIWLIFASCSIVGTFGLVIPFQIDSVVFQFPVMPHPSFEPMTSALKISLLTTALIEIYTFVIKSIYWVIISEGISFLFT